MNWLRKQLSTDEVALSYLAGAKAGPPLVFLHGVAGRALRWLDHMEHFAARWQVFALDARGHGRSGRTPGRYRWIDHARDVAAFLEAAVPEPALVVGHSLGALAALQVAAERPQRFAALVLEDPPLYAAEHPDADFSQFRAVERAVRAGLSAEQLLAAWPRTPGVSEALLREYAEGFTELDPENLTVTISLEASRQLDVDACLRRVRCPTLVLRGETSWVLSEAELSRAEGHLADVRSVTIPGSGHLIHAEQSERYRAELERFFSDLR